MILILIRINESVFSIERTFYDIFYLVSVYFLYAMHILSNVMSLDCWHVAYYYMENCRNILTSFIWKVSYHNLLCTDTEVFQGWPVTIIQVQESIVFNIIIPYIDNKKYLRQFHLIFSNILWLNFSFLNHLSNNILELMLFVPRNILLIPGNYIFNSIFTPYFPILLFPIFNIFIYLSSRMSVYEICFHLQNNLIHFMWFCCRLG